MSLGVRIIAFINEASTVRKILDHISYGTWLYGRNRSISGLGFSLSVCLLLGRKRG